MSNGTLKQLLTAGLYTNDDAVIQQEMRVAHAFFSEGVVCDNLQDLLHCEKEVRAMFLFFSCPADGTIKDQMVHEALETHFLSDFPYWLKDMFICFFYLIQAKNTLIQNYKLHLESNGGRRNREQYRYTTS